jgi:hypothetical protein
VLLLMLCCLVLSRTKPPLHAIYGSAQPIANCFSYNMNHCVQAQHGQLQQAAATDVIVDRGNVYVIPAT